MLGLIPFNKKLNDLINISFDDFSNIFDDFFTGSWLVQRSLAADTFKIDIQDNDTEYIIEAELPGVKKENIEITLNEERLNISVKKEKVSEDKSKKFIHRERKYAQMSRSILLADSNNEGIQAKLEEGVLTIKVPKKVDTSKRIIIE